MGLYRTDYIVYGWKLPKEIYGFDYWDEKYLPYIEGHPGIKYQIIRGKEMIIRCLVMSLHIQVNGILKILI
jgi:hypothetical protein